jgi:hypothetical protein
LIERWLEHLTTDESAFNFQIPKRFFPTPPNSESYRIERRSAGADNRFYIAVIGLSPLYRARPSPSLLAPCAKRKLLLHLL